MTLAIELVTAALVVVGAIFSLLAAVGIVRLPDVYSRMHAASKAGTVGSGLLLIALGLHALDGGTFMRAIAGVIFLLLTAPISAHLLARAAYAAGYTLSPLTVLNEMPVEPGSASASGSRSE
jgi:multicomponent Na+:H+ antiporter subunit G